MIIVGIAFDIADAHIDEHVSILKRSGAEILVFAGVPTTASQVIRLAADFHWRPVFLLNDAAASIGTALGPAGVENSSGVISANFLKDPSDPTWNDDPAINDWLSFMDRYYPLPRKRDAALKDFQPAVLFARHQDQHGSG